MDEPYDQARDEWVLLLRGEGRLWLEGVGERTLGPGDHLLIPSRRKHRVAWTSPDESMVWLAIHIGEGR